MTIICSFYKHLSLIPTVSKPVLPDPYFVAGSSTVHDRKLLKPGKVAIVKPVLSVNYFTVKYGRCLAALVAFWKPDENKIIFLLIGLGSHSILTVRSSIPSCHGKFIITKCLVKCEPLSLLLLKDFQRRYLHFWLVESHVQ